MAEGGQTPEEMGSKQLPNEEVISHATRLLREFKETLEGLPEVQQAVVESFFEPLDYTITKGNQRVPIHFQKGDMVYMVDVVDGGLHINRGPEGLKDKPWPYVYSQEDRGRTWYGEEVSISTPHQDPKGNQHGGFLFGSADTPATGDSYIEHRSSDTRFALDRIEKVLADLKSS